MSHAILVIDLGYGDSGKGTTVDYLARQHDAHTVIRFNGGAQAAHNVVSPDGRHHTFAQFGSAMFIPGVQSYLTRDVLIEPVAMFNEEAHLRTLGVRSAFARTAIDRGARVITPYQQIANRLRERARGAARHGSCGLGIGETVADSLRWGDEVILRAGDLADVAAVNRKLRLLRDAKRAELAAVFAALADDAPARREIGIFNDEETLRDAAAACTALGRCVRLVDESHLRETLARPGITVWEGAQGVLIDEDYGFHPYTTWSHTGYSNADALLVEHGFAGEVTRLGVLRTYFTRHGAGPFVTEDAALAEALPEPHNGYGEWQRAFRIGAFDVVAARYALEAAGGTDALVLTHVDALAAMGSWRTCVGYHYVGDAADLSGYFDHDGARITAIRVQRPPSLDHQARLGALLNACTPVYATIGTRAEDVIAFIERALGVRVAITSHGTRAGEKVSRN